MITLYAVDDDDVFLDTLIPLVNINKILSGRENVELCGSWSRVKTNEDVEELIDNIAMHQPDIVLMDISFALEGRPKDYGIHLTQKIKERCPNQKILMLAKDAENDDEQRGVLQRSFQAGAVGYLSKGYLDTWYDAISEIMNGDNFISENIKELLVRQVTRSNSFELSLREIEVIYLLSKDMRIGEVAKAMRREDGKSLAFAGANFHIQHARLKLNVRTNQGLVAKAFRENIII